MSSILIDGAETGAGREAVFSLGLVGPLPPPSGGMANQTLQLARLLTEAGITVEVIQVNAHYRPAWIGQIWGLRALFRLIPYVVRLWCCAGRVDIFHVMANSGWAWHLFAAPAVWLASMRGKPVIINYRGGEAESFFASQFRWVRPTLARASAVVVPSRFLEMVFGKRGIRTETVPNIIDLTRFFPGEVRQRRCHVIVTRNLENIYDIPTALRAFVIIRNSYPQARLTVAGSGPQLEQLMELCSELHVTDAVRFSGRLDNEQIADLYRDADLMLNPSLADNMPISLLEAMASGVPIVSTDVGGIPYLVEDGVSAMLVPPGQPALMAASAMKVLSDPVLSSELRAAGRDLAARYTWPMVRERLFATYSRCLG
jgi:glycosyltransferase involved in cell wall biosynthesis